VHFKFFIIVSYRVSNGFVLAYLLIFSINLSRCNLFVTVIGYSVFHRLIWVNLTDCVVYVAGILPATRNTKKQTSWKFRWSLLY